MIKVLHIANWYPNKFNLFEALWIRNHLNSLSSQGIYNEVYHLEIKRGGMVRLIWDKSNNHTTHLLLYLPITIWKINEFLSFILVFYILFFRVKLSDYEVLNFHIAYPNCTYLHWIKKWIAKPIVITEHWSAYHYNFNINNPKKRKPIQKIFKHQIPVITVSQALGNDIRKFVGQDDFPIYVVPNIVNTDIFNHKVLPLEETPTFFMVSQWKEPKRPILVLKAFTEIIRKYPNVKLRIGGYGPQEKEILQFINTKQLQRNVIYLGKLEASNIAIEMNKAWAFVHSSDYETFSVVCAEAICCGTPVIASAVGGIKSYVNSTNGLLIERNETNLVHKNLTYLIENIQNYDRVQISESAQALFNSTSVGKRYKAVLEKVISSES